MGDTDDHKASETRRVLARLAMLSDRAGMSILIVQHLNKGTGKASHRVMGSGAYVHAARAACLLVADPEDSTGARRLFLPIKQNLSSKVGGLACSLVDCPHQPKTPWIVWEEGRIDTSAAEALAPAEQEQPGATVSAAT